MTSHISPDRPANEPTEIEITPEMIDAAYEAARLYDEDDPREWEWWAVYRAMEAVRRGEKP